MVFMLLTARNETRPGGVHAGGSENSEHFSTIMNKNDNKQVTAGADEAPVGKLKLSDIVAAMRAGAIEPDCKAVLAFCDEDGSGSMLDFNLLSFGKKSDVSLMLVHLGVPALMKGAMSRHPRCASVLIEAAYKSERGNFASALLGAIFGKGDNNEEEGKDNE